MVMEGRRALSRKRHEFEDSRDGMDGMRWGCEHIFSFSFVQCFQSFTFMVIFFPRDERCVIKMGIQRSSCMGLVRLWDEFPIFQDVSVL